MATIKFKVREIENLTSEEKAKKKEEFAKAVKNFGKLKQNNFLNLIVNKAGQLNKRNKTKIEELLKLIGRFSKSVSDDGVIEWNVAKGSKIHFRFK